MLGLVYLVLGQKASYPTPRMQMDITELGKDRKGQLNDGVGALSLSHNLIRYVDWQSMLSLFLHHLSYALLPFLL